MCLRIDVYTAVKRTGGAFEIKSLKTEMLVFERSAQNSDCVSTNPYRHTHTSFPATTVYTDPHFAEQLLSVPDGMHVRCWPYSSHHNVRLCMCLWTTYQGEARAVCSVGKIYEMRACLVARFLDDEDIILDFFDGRSDRHDLLVGGHSSWQDNLSVICNSSHGSGESLDATHLQLDWSSTEWDHDHRSHELASCMHACTAGQARLCC